MHQEKVEKSFKTDEETIKYLSTLYTGTAYQYLATTQFMLSRQKEKSIEDSIKDVYAKILEVTTREINKYELQSNSI